MKLGRRLLHFTAFLGLVTVTAFSVARIVQPSITRDLLLVAALAVMAGAPGLIHRRLLPVSVVLLPLGMYLVVRLVIPLPAEIDGWHAQYRFYTEELHHGVTAYANDIFPLTLTGIPGLTLLILVWEYIIAGAASVFTLGGRRPLLGVGMLLAVLGAGLTVDASSSEPVLVGAFLLCAVLVLVTAQGLSRRRWGLRDVIAGLGLGGVGILAAVVLLSSQPGLVHQGWENWRSWDPFGPGSGGGTVFNWRQNYPRLLDPGNDEPVMVVTSPLPTYWRATTLESFTGYGWVSRAAFGHRLPDGAGPRPIRIPERIPAYGEEVTLKFELIGLTTSYLFSGGRPTTLTLEDSTAVWVSDAGALSTSRTIEPPFNYRLTAVIPRVRPEQLVGLGRDYPPEYRDTYLSVRTSPADEFRDLSALNRTIVGDATDPYEQTLRIERYLRTNFRYSLLVPPSSFSSPIAAFLFDTHTGYCQHFAGAMALLLRLNGIPSRVAVGFVTGTLIGTQTYQVTTNNAHSWVEVYFPGVGWLPFDPTPGRALPLAGVSSTSPGFIDPFPHQAPATGVTTTPTIPSARDRLPQDVRAPVSKPGGGTPNPWNLPLLFLPVGLVAALAAWPLVRRRLRERRLHHGTPARRLRASLDLLRADVAAWGLPVTGASTLDEVAAMVATAGVGALLPVAERAQAVFFGGSAASLGDVHAAERARQAVVAALRKRQSWVRTVYTWYGLSRLRKGVRLRERSAQT